MAHIRLHVQQANGGLPMVCMRCGETATVVKSKKMTWYPRWIIFLILLSLPGIVLMVILAMVLRRSAQLQAPLCERHRGHWTVRVIAIWATSGLLALMGFAAVAAFIAIEVSRRFDNQQADTLGMLICLGGAIGFVGWLVILVIVQNTMIRPDEITRTHILLNGVSEAFVNAVEEAEIERRVRLRQWQDADDRELTPRQRSGDLSQPSKSPSVEAIEEERRPRPAPPGNAVEE
jgi:hypothetical protein